MISRDQSFRSAENVTVIGQILGQACYPMSEDLLPVPGDAMTPEAIVDSPVSLNDRLDALMARDRGRLRARIQSLRLVDGASLPTEVAADLTRAEARVARRRSALPQVTYPEELPVTQRREDLLAAIAAHQIVIVAGDTGSGKSTQIPKLCLELGRGVKGVIGHTQPRRLAARTIAERVASELGVSVGGSVGYAVRFADKVGDDTHIKVMTDGILLAEIQRDRDLLRYDTLIIDEAHERSLNIDFLLGYLTRLLPRRPDLKVIITSATIDTERFAEHFAAHLGRAVPVIEVTGRTYPVEIRYRPIETGGGDDRDQPQAIADAVDELIAEGPGDILVFLSGEREIKDAADHLKERDNLDILPLYARLSSAEQHRVFEPHSKRRIVLATNVAETSLTVPGIRSVIDTGTARVSRFSKRLKVQQLPIEAISQASANQRSGRCGRLGPGIAIRLYDDLDDFQVRPAFTEPEILRTNLASVILQMAAFGFGDMETFPFVEPPDSQTVKDGVALLEELGAFDGRSHLTPLGRKLARLPLDPRLGRMVLESERLQCVRELVIITAALSIQDPRERPQANREAANTLHRRFANEQSDFVSILNLWEYLKEQQRDLSGNQFRKRCKSEYLNYLRIREWQDIVSQLRQVLAELQIRSGPKGAHHDRVHQALLSGLLTHIGQRDDEIGSPAGNRDPKRQHQKQPQRLQRPGREFRGVRNARFAVAPGSSLARKPPQWIMAAELVETSRLWARTCAQIDPLWVEAIGEHLIKRSYSEPRWDGERGAAMATERVLLHGLSVVEQRTIQFARVDPVGARTLFIRHALVLHEWRATHSFIAHNQRLIDRVLALEARVRRRDLLVNDDVIHAIFDFRVPDHVVTTKHFDAWWKKASVDFPKLLHFSESDVLDEDSGAVALQGYPDRWEEGGHDLPLSYVYEPFDDADGVTADIALVLLNQLDPTAFDWLVPGRRNELVSELIRALPKQARRQLVPAPEYASYFLERADLSKPLRKQFSSILGHAAGVPINPADVRTDLLPDHLRFRFRLLDKHGNELGTSRDLRELIVSHGPQARSEVASALPSIERDDVRAWNFGDLPAQVRGTVGSATVLGYPALVDEGRKLTIRVLSDPLAQERAMWLGTQRLLHLELGPTALRQLRKAVNSSSATLLALARHGDVDGMLEDCLASSIELLTARHGGPVFSEVAFGELRQHVDRELVATARPAVDNVARLLERNDRIEDRLSQLTSATYDQAVVDITRQLHRIVPDGFVLELGVARLGDAVRYLDAIERRVDKLPADPAKDGEKMKRIQNLERLCDATGDPGVVVRVRWMLEELRVSVFAQDLGTNGAISEERIRKALL